MYEAILEIGGYKPGDVVPDEKAIAWIKQYAVPHVKKIHKDENKEEPKKEEPIDIADDYLDRNEATVLKNIKGDVLNKQFLKALLKREQADKKRKAVIRLIKRKL